MARQMPERDWDERRTGGAGATTQPLTNGEYRRQMDKLMALNAADSREE